MAKSLDGYDPQKIWGKLGVILLNNRNSKLDIFRTTSPVLKAQKALLSKRYFQRYR